MYWSDWGASPKIERCGMNGDLSTRETIVGDDLVYPNGLSIDYGEEKLWWADADLDKVEMANLDGSMRRVVLTEPSIHPFSIVVYNDSIIWTDWVKNNIIKADKFAGKIYSSTQVRFRPTGIKVIYKGAYHPGMCKLLLFLVSK